MKLFLTSFNTLKSVESKKTNTKQGKKVRKKIMISVKLELIQNQVNKIMTTKEKEEETIVSIIGQREKSV